MKPLHSKLFSMVDAQDGAPYSFDDGECAEIIKWNRNGQHPIVVMCGKRQDVYSLGVDGYGGAGQLVMLPLGIIDGKPVFVGDELTYAEDTRRTFTAQPRWDQESLNAGSGCIWPAPANVYPQTLMTYLDLVNVYENFDKFQVALKEVANAAICHAIDAGQVIIAEVKS